ncbi:MAG: PHP domain-containing protein [Chitinispirillaceae bacterium]|nr:PHP domain-containing protein [Chitinispirillaceae bacterium]
MLTVDLHVHSLFSSCGLHTVLELVDQARRIGLKAMAITDHGPAVGTGHLTSVFFERFNCPYDDLVLYKGIELNLLDEKGNIDMVWPFMPFVDLLLLGIHPNLPPHAAREKYTGMLLAAIEKNTFVDIITHPNDPAYPLDYVRLAKKAKKTGIALELNNSKILYNRSTVEDTLELIAACKQVGCLIAVNSDTHAILELGGDESVRPLLDRAGFPADLVVNRDAQSAAAFIEDRRGFKKEVGARNVGDNAG